MSYLETLQQHNTDLQGLIDKANALPDAGSGGGGSVETCTVTASQYEASSPPDNSQANYWGVYYDKDLNLKQFTAENWTVEEVQIFGGATTAYDAHLTLNDVAKGTLIFFDVPWTVWTSDEEVEVLRPQYHINGSRWFVVNGDTHFEG